MFSEVKSKIVQVLAVLILWRCGLSSTEVRFLRRELHTRYLDFILFLFLRPKRLPGHQIPIESCSLIGAGSRLLYVTGCKSPLKLDPPRMSTKDAVLQPLSFVCRLFTLTSDRAFNRSIHLGIHLETNWSSCSSMIAAVFVSAI